MPGNQSENGAGRAANHVITTEVSNTRRLKVTAVGEVLAGNADLLGLGSPGRITTCNMVVDGTSYTVSLTDTGGMEELDRLQPPVYRDTDCFLLCYSESSRDSFASVESKWCSEITSICPNVPFVLVGCTSASASGGGVTSVEGQKLQHKINATSHAIYTPGALDTVLTEAVRTALSHAPAKQQIQSDPSYLDDAGEHSRPCCCLKLPCFGGKDSSYSFQ